MHILLWRCAMVRYTSIFFDARFALFCFVRRRKPSTWCHDFFHFFSLCACCALAIRLHTSTSTLHLRFLHFTIDMYIIFMVNYFEMNFSPIDKWQRITKNNRYSLPIVNETNSNRNSRNFCTRTLSIKVCVCSCVRTCVKNWTFYFSIRQILIKEFL